MATERAPSVSTHVLDQELGEPARGLEVTFSRRDEGGLVELSSRLTDEDGRAENLAGGELSTGTYQIVFDVAGYFRQRGREAPFLSRAAFDFQITDATRHYHVPLLLSPYSCTTYRGS